MKLVVAGAKAGTAFIASVKQAHKQFPKAYTTTKMSGAPSGSWVPPMTQIDGVAVICAGFKYNGNKILFFCWPVGAASCVQGEPYIARYQDDDGNPATRSVARLSVFSRYLMYSILVDVDNELRQHFLALEEHWVTTDCWSRLFTGLIGIALTDCFVAYKAELNDGHEDKRICIEEIAAQAALQSIESRLGGRRLESMATSEPPEVFSGCDSRTIDGS